MPEFDKFEFMRKLAASKHELEQDNVDSNEVAPTSENSGEESQTAQEENSEKAYNDTNNGKSDVVICQGCGKKIGAKAKFCPNCGFTLGIETKKTKEEDIKAENDTITDSNTNVDGTEEENSENDEQSENIEENKTDITICQKCHNKCAMEDDFCGKCGTKLVKNTNKCPKCGFECKKGDVFCRKCGNKLSSPELAESTKYQNKENIYNKCPNCGANNTLQAKYNHSRKQREIFCIKCGEKFDFYKPQNTNKLNSINQQEKQKQIFCPACGNPCKQDEIFCGECGEKIEKLDKQQNTENTENNIKGQLNSNITNDKISQFICPYCKKIVPIGASKCSHCGEWLKRDSRIGCFGTLNTLLIILSILSGIIYYLSVPNAAPFIILIIICLYILFLIYFIPTWVAERRNHPSSTAIFILNLLLGETIIFWVIALIWALSGGNRK